MGATLPISWPPGISRLPLKFHESKPHPTLLTSSTGRMKWPIGCRLYAHDGSGPSYTFFIETHLPSLSKTTSPWKAFSRNTLHVQPFSLLATVNSLAVTIPGPTRSEPYNDNMAAALILASSSVVTRINP